MTLFKRLDKKLEQMVTDTVYRILTKKSDRIWKTGTYKDPIATICDDNHHCIARIHVSPVMLHDAIQTFVEPHVKQEVVSLKKYVDFRAELVYMDRVLQKLGLVDVPKEELRGFLNCIKKHNPGMVEYVCLRQTMTEQVWVDTAKEAKDAIRPLIVELENDVGLSDDLVQKIWSYILNFGQGDFRGLTRATVTLVYTEPVKKIFGRIVVSILTMLSLLSISMIWMVLFLIMKIVPWWVCGLYTVLTVGVGLIWCNITEHVINLRDDLLDYTEYRTLYMDALRFIAEEESVEIADELGIILYSEDDEY